MRWPAAASADSGRSRRSPPTTGSTCSGPRAASRSDAAVPRGAIAWEPANGDRMRWRGTGDLGGQAVPRPVVVLVAVAALVYAADVISQLIVVDRKSVVW